MFKKNQLIVNTQNFDQLRVFHRRCGCCRQSFRTTQPFQQYCSLLCERTHFESLPRARHNRIVSLMGGLIHIVERVFNRVETETITQHTLLGKRKITRQISVTVRHTDIIEY